MLATLLWPLEIVQRLAAKYGPWLIKPALPHAERGTPGTDHHYNRGLGLRSDPR